MNMDYNMPLSKAKIHLKLSQRDKGYAITGVGRYDGKKFEPYDDGHYLLDWRVSTGAVLKNYKQRIVEIPDYINKIEVISVATKSISKYAVVLCSEKVFSKLTRETKAQTSLAYLEDSSIFKEDEVRKIEEFIREYSEDLLVLIKDNISAEALTKYLSLATLNNDQIDILAEKFGNVAELKSILLDKSATGINKELDLELNKKQTVTEIKKNWTFTKGVIKKYKGHEKRVVVPDVIGKNKVEAVSWLYEQGLPHGLFEGNRYVEYVTIPDTIPRINTYRMFFGCSNLKEVVLGDNVTTLREDFMVHCKNVDLYVTEKLVRIDAENPSAYFHGKRSFDYCENIIIHAPKGSYAIEYAKEHNMSFVEV